MEVTLAMEAGQAVLKVSDTGQGISSSFLPHIFERFRQEDASASRRYMGLGLGLAIIHHIVELHGGHINAYSAGEGKGATFTLSLPLVDQEFTVPIQDSVHAVKQEAILGGTRILVVEDDEDVRDTLAAALQLAGAEVAVAAGATEALAVAPQFQPTVLVSDIGMPDEDGYVLLEKLRTFEKQQGRKPIPAIALTGYAQPEDVERTRKAGYQSHLAKPVELDRLTDEIRRLLVK